MAKSTHDGDRGLQNNIYIPKRRAIWTYISQIRRSASSIAANITEGCARGSNSDFARFLHISMGSANELEYQLLLACELGFISSPDFESLKSKIWEIKSMLAIFIQKLKAKI